MYMTTDMIELIVSKNSLGGGVARRGGLQRGSEARPMEVRSDRTPPPEREQKALRTGTDLRIGRSTEKEIRS